MTASSLLAARMKAQLLTTPAGNALSAVEKMGALQGQDFAMSRIAVALRSRNTTEKDVIKALNAGQILRTHILRPTWHLVSQKDIEWMTDLSAPGIRQAAGSRHRELGLDDKTLNRALKTVARLLDKGECTRDDLAAGLSKAKIRTDGNRLSHIMMEAELSKIACSGSVKGSRQLYASFDQRVKKRSTKKKDEALHDLATIYFESRGPATAADFTWWSGLKTSDAKNAVASANLKTMKFKDVTYYVTRRSTTTALQNKVMLLPAYDEWLISYKDRSSTISATDHRTAVSVNGIFFPIVVHKGHTIGKWKADRSKQAVQVNLFDGRQAAGKRLISQAMKKISAVLEMDLSVSF